MPFGIERRGGGNAMVIASRMQLAHKKKLPCLHKVPRPHAIQVHSAGESLSVPDSIVRSREEVFADKCGDLTAEDVIDDNGYEGCDGNAESDCRVRVEGIRIILVKSKCQRKVVGVA